MASENNSAGSQLWPGISVLLLFLSSTFLVTQTPYKGLRPSGSEKLEYRTVQDQDVDARLWQDPFRAVDQHKNSLKKSISGSEEINCERNSVGISCRTSKKTRMFPVKCNPEKTFRSYEMLLHSIDHLKCSIETNALQEKKETAVLAVMVPVGPYIDKEEVRRKTRYAVLAALNSSGYVPEEDEHIGYFDLPGQTHDLHVTIPYERLKYCKREQSLKETVGVTTFCEKPSFNHELVVLWIDDWAASDDPLRNLQGLREDLGLTKSSNFKIIGPYGSDDFERMYAMLNKASPRDALARSLCDLELYSPFATAKGIGDFISGINAVMRKTECQKGREPFHIFRMLALDDQVAGTIYDDLKLREDPGLPVLGHIFEMDQPVYVLVSEWDTVYARTLTATLANKLARASLDECQSGKKGIYCFTYLRGLDGTLPIAKSGTDASKETKESGKESDTAKLIEWAEGNEQRDYLRRLASRIRDDMRRHNLDKVTAIGLLGSDFHDKLLLLQALKVEFPETLFFTTDLDARYLHPAVFNWTRNLIVGSAFGLTLRPELQKDVPPFRDSYQTATYLATSVAAHNIRSGANARENWRRNALIDSESIESRIAPRVFEIGRDRAFDLSAMKLDAKQCDRLDNCNDFQPPLSDMSAPRKVGYLIAALAFSMVLAWLLSHKVQRAWRWLLFQKKDLCDRKQGEGWFATFVTWVIIVILCAALIWIFWHLRNVLPTGKTEPFSIAGGISVWPTEFVRLTAIALCIFFLSQAWRGNRENLKVLSEEFALPQIASGADTGCTSRGSVSIHDWCAPVLFVDKPEEEHRVDVRDLWDQYQRRGRWLPRAVRVAICTIVFMIFAFLIFIYAGFPNRPLRGDCGSTVFCIWTLDTVTLAFLVVLFVALVFSVADATRLCARWVENLQYRKSKYPDAIIDAVTNKWGLYYAHIMSEVEDWLDIQIIARRSEFVTGLVYYPFIILALIVLARSPIFDAWPFHAGLWIVLFCAFVIAAACGHSLRNVAEKARAVALERLTQQVWALRAGHGPAAEKALAQIESLLQDVREMRRGAFCPFSQQPIVRAMLVPLGSVGSLQLIEYLIALPH